MAIFPPQVSQDELQRLCLLKARLKRSELQDSEIQAIESGDVTDPKANVVRPPLSRALAEELRRFTKDESGFSFIDWAITVSLISMLVGFFMPDLWALFDHVMQGITNDVDRVAVRVKYLD